MEYFLNVVLFCGLFFLLCFGLNSMRQNLLIDPLIHSQNNPCKVALDSLFAHYFVS